MVTPELLVEFGFVKKEKGKVKLKNGKPIPDEEEREISSKGDYGPTGFPTPHKSYELHWEMYDMSIEGPYFWMVDDLRQYCHAVEKIEDTFSAAENSAFFGVSQQRLGAQQDKISQLLATTGKMIKELFQMVRELRIIDERLGYYRSVDAEMKKEVGQRSRSDNITLKGMFVDLVQGGGKSAASVYGMARELEFITLPDLFFDAPPFKDKHELGAHIETLKKDFNNNVLRVLERHLNQYSNWRSRTHKEHEQRRRFMLQYLLQHFEIIKMYIVWIKPYLRNVDRLSLRDRGVRTADLISAFEGSLLDLEIIARKKKDGANGCLLVTFNYRTRPEMKVVQEGYQRGPVHIGKLVLNIRVYSWSDEEVNNYKKMKEKENLLLMGDVSSTVQAAMQSLGDELDVYIEEARGLKDKKKEEEKKEAKPQKSIMQSMFGDFYRAKQDTGPTKQQKKDDLSKKAKIERAKPAMKKWAMAQAFNQYKNFKKAHRLVMW